MSRESSEEMWTERKGQGQGRANGKDPNMGKESSTKAITEVEKIKGQELTGSREGNETLNGRQEEKRQEVKNANKEIVHWSNNEMQDLGRI